MIHLSIEVRSSGTVVSTIDFGTDTYTLLDGYYPQSRDDNSPITEAFDVRIAGATETALISSTRALEQALEFARDHQAGPDGAWLLFSPHDGTVDPWQSRLSGGALIMNKQLTRNWRDKKIITQVVVERVPFWETTAPVTLLLTNRGGTGATANIVNHQDGDATDDLYAEIAADQVTGSLPTPAIIEFKNTLDNIDGVGPLIVGHFAASGANDPPAASSLILEGAGHLDATSSGGTHADLSWTGTAENQLTTWTIASAAFRGRNYKMIARLAANTAYTDLWLKCKLRMGSTVLAETRWSLVYATHAIAVIGTLQIPPFRFGTYYDLGNLTLALYESRAGGTGGIELDYIAMFPQDSWRKFAPISGLSYNETMIDDPVTGTLATLYSTSSHKVTHVLEEGEPVMLQPGVKNVLYFSQELMTGVAPIAQPATIAVKIHPRRRTV